ncbi:hypothetical protein Ancab_030728 [Ancistrocladus abbreviatus]
MREQGQDDGQPEKQGRSLQKLKAFDTLSIRAFNSTVKEHKHVSAPSTAKVPRSYVPISVTPPTEPRGVGKIKKEAEVDDKPRIRASSVPRPRAVLSSPDNDEMIGSRIKVRTERPPALKDLNQLQGQHSKCKATPSTATAQSPMERQAEYRQTANKNNAKGKKGLAIPDGNHRAHIGKSNPSLTRI